MSFNQVRQNATPRRLKRRNRVIGHPGFGVVARLHTDINIGPEKICSTPLSRDFFIGELDNPQHHHPMELAATLVVNLIAMTLKFGDRTHIGAVHLATSIVAVVQLVAATADDGSGLSSLSQLQSLAAPLAKTGYGRYLLQLLQEGC